jgi:hypothetical protein
MQKNNSNKIEESLLAKIIAVAYGDAGLMDKIKIYKLAKKNALVKQLLIEYRLTANTVHKIEETELPASISDKVRSRIEGESNSNAVGSFIYSRLFARPILSTSVALLLMIGIVGIFLFTKPASESKYSKIEIELAQQQFEHSLAIVGKVFRHAEKKLEVEVISKHVSKPLNTGLIYLNDYLIGG